MLIVLMGPPGSGKGLQGQLLMERYSVGRISSGDMLRERMGRGDAFAKELKDTLAAGRLVSDDVMIRMINERVQLDDCKNGFILDGFPRTVAQAEALAEGGLTPTHVLVLDVPSDVIVERIAGRLVHPASGRVYHKIFSPPVSEGLDDVTQEPLVQRDDDRRDRVEGRLNVYHSQTKPVIEYYAQTRGWEFHRVNGNRAPDMVQADLVNILSS